MGAQAIGFNRVAEASLGSSASPSGGVQASLLCSILEPVDKELNSIHLSVADGSGPYTVEEYQIRVAVFDQKGLFPDLPSVLNFTPSNVSGIDALSGVGNKYYDAVITLPYNNPIIFDTPMLFAGGVQIHVVCSIPYANGDSIITPPNRYVRMSVNGRLISSPAYNYKQR